MKLIILGCYAATPRTITNPTSQVLEMGGHMFLIDAGEGTQVQLRRHKLKFQRINHIFISHLHGNFLKITGFKDGLCGITTDNMQFIETQLLLLVSLFFRTPFSIHLKQGYYGNNRTYYCNYDHESI